MTATETQYPREIDWDEAMAKAEELRPEIEKLGFATRIWADPNGQAPGVQVFLVDGETDEFSRSLIFWADHEENVGPSNGAVCVAVKWEAEFCGLGGTLYDVHIGVMQRLWLNQTAETVAETLSPFLTMLRNGAASINPEEA